MLSFSANSTLAVACPPTTIKTAENKIFILHMTRPEVAPLAIELPTCYTNAAKEAKFCNEWFQEFVDTEGVTPQEFSRVAAIVTKKNTNLPIVTGAAFGRFNEEDYLAITVEGYGLYIYKIALADDKLSAELFTAVGFPRHLSLVTFTHHNNNKHLIVTDNLGDMYALTMTSCVAPLSAEDKIDPKLLFSHGTRLTTLETFSAQRTPGSEPEHFLLGADSECKIRVSHFPQFFDVQAYCMGSRSIPTATVHISTSQANALLFTTTCGGFDLKNITDNQSGWTPYDPTTTSYTIHNIFTGDLIVHPTVVSHKASFDTAGIDITEESATSFAGLATVNNVESPQTGVTYLYGIISNTRQPLLPNGLPILADALVKRPTLHHGLTEFTVTAPDAATATVAVRDNVQITNIADFTAQLSNDDFIHTLCSPPQASNTFYAMSLTGKVITLTREVKTGDIKIQRVVDCVQSTASAPPTTTPESRCDPNQLAIARNLNFHFKFQRYAELSRQARLREKNDANKDRSIEQNKKNPKKQKHNQQQSAGADTTTSVADDNKLVSLTGDVVTPAEEQQ